MPEIFHHFIECSWGACYNSVYQNLLVPHLDSPDVVDYVLRSAVVHSGDDVVQGITGARVFGELMSRLRNVESDRIRTYLEITFSNNLR